MDYPTQAMKPKPCIHLTSEDLPELKDATIGKEYKLEVTVTVGELHNHSFDTADRKDIVGADLDIEKITMKGGE